MRDIPPAVWLVILAVVIVVVLNARNRRRNSGGGSAGEWIFVPGLRREFSGGSPRKSSLLKTIVIIVAGLFAIYLWVAHTPP